MGVGGDTGWRQRCKDRGKPGGQRGGVGGQGGGSGGRTGCAREREGKSGRLRERILSHLNLASRSSDKAGEGATSVIFQAYIQENILSK